MASILSQVSDCCTPCCDVQIVDLPAGGGGGVNYYDTVDILRQETRTTILVDDTPAQVYGRPTQGEVGSGFFYFDAASTLADDDVSIIKPNSIVGSNPGRWIKWK